MYSEDNTMYYLNEDQFNALDVKDQKNYKKESSNDNAGFANFGTVKKDIFIEMIRTLAKENNVDLYTHTITIFGEWAGPGIQKAVGISSIPEKCMFIFASKVSHQTDISIKSYYIDSSKLKNEENRIYNIDDFPSYEIEIDFNNPKLSNNKMIEMMLEVENECPVSKQLGYPNTIGEGIVFSYNHNNILYTFKVKGDKHSNSSKVTTLKPVDNERINRIIELAQLITPGWRLEQMYNLTFDTINGGIPDIKLLGKFIKSVIADVQKEELDVIDEHGFELKDVAKYISDITKKYFFVKEEESL